MSKPDMWHEVIGSALHVHFSWDRNVYSYSERSLVAFANAAVKRWGFGNLGHYVSSGGSSYPYGRERVTYIYALPSK